jgi:2-C-methyl-D-erythritol 4-phosphate cytidylyltransferase
VQPKTVHVPNVAIVLASGSGVRFEAETPKQFLKLAGKTVLEHTLDAFERNQRIDEIIVVVSPEYRLFVEQIVTTAEYVKVKAIVHGGNTRRASSASGVAAVINDNAKVLVHDAVRPLLDQSTIDRCLDALELCDAVDTAIPSGDTVIAVDENNSIVDIPDRATLRLGQTPQGFRAGLLKRAHALANCDADLNVTDDCSLVLHYDLGRVTVVAGDVNNIKITYPSDIYLADRLFQLRSRQIVRSDVAERLREKVVVVFGASRGIGERIAVLARSSGAHVIGVSRQNGVDVANPADVRRILDDAMHRYKRLDMVANTAGLLRTGLLAGQDYQAIDELLSTNLRGSIVVAREAFELLKGAGGSIALFTSSSYTRGRARSCIYSATKAAVVNLMQGLAQEYNSFGVRINAINPERTATPMRTENFGHEPPSELLDVDTVAKATLSAMLSGATGEVIDVRR